MDPLVDLVCDAIVVGAGPAGATVARLLSRAGWSVVLLERRAESRGKCCGHCLSAGAMPLLRRLGLGEAVDDASLGGLHSLHIEVASTAGGRACTLTAPLSQRDGEPGRLVDRATLDSALVQWAGRAGVEVVRPCSVVGIDAIGMAGAVALGRVADRPWQIAIRREGCARIEYMECSLLVGADGLGSGIARRFGWSDPQPGRAFGFSADLPAATLPELPAGQIRMHVVPGGYLGVVRGDSTFGDLGSRIHIGALVHGDASRRGPREFMQHVAERCGAARGLGSVAAEAECLAAGPMPWRPRCVSGSGVALVGDAAGFVEPFTGEGMAWAFESAAMLAEVAGAREGRAALRFDAAAAVRYAALWRDGIGRAHRRCAWVSALAAHPALLRAGIAVAPAIARAVTRRALRRHRATAAATQPHVGNGATAASTRALGA